MPTTVSTPTSLLREMQTGHTIKCEITRCGGVATSGMSKEVAAHVFHDKGWRLHADIVHCPSCARDRGLLEG